MAGGKDSNVSEHSGKQQKEIPWDRLPLLAWEKIFSHLSLSDKSKASTVCKYWSEIYDSPSLWRDPTIKFEKCKKCKSGLDKRKLVYKYGAFFRRLTILYNRRNCSSLKFVSRQLSEFLLAMTAKGVQLKSLRMPRMMMAVAHGLYFQFEYCQPLKKFLVTQKELSYVDFTNARALAVSGLTILESLVPQPIQHLRLENFFRSRISSLYSHNRYLAAMCRFKYLKSLSINYDYLSNDVMALLSSELTGQLENLFILCQVYRAVRNIITDENWKNFGKTCKNLEVKFRLEIQDLPTQYVLDCGIISPFMPVREIEFQLINIWNQDDCAIFSFLADTFSTGLRSVMLDFGGVSGGGVTRGVHELVYRCVNLEKLSIGIRIPICHIEQLLQNLHGAIVVSSQERPVSMTEFRATFRGLTTQEKSTLKNLKHKYVEQFKHLGVLFKLKSRKLS